MAAILVGLRGGSGQQGGSSYYAVGASVMATQSTTLAPAQVSSPAGDYSKFSINVLSYYGPSNTLRIHLTVNGVSTQLIAPPAGATGRFENLTDVVTVADGDLVAWRFQGSGAPYTNSCGPLTAVFESASGAPSQNLIASGVSTAWGTGTSYAAPAGAVGSVPSSELSNTDIARAAAVYSHLKIRVNTNTRTNDGTLYFRQNGADTALTVTVPAGTTGRFEDAVNTVAVVPGDVIGYRFDGGGGSGNLNVLWLGSRATAADGKFDLFSSAPGAGSNINAAGYIPGVGSSSASAVEDSVQIKVHLDAEVSHLRVYMSQINGTATFVTRINGVDGNQTLSVPTSTSGYYEDSTHVDAVFEGDLFSVACTSSSGQARISSLATTWSTGLPPVEVYPAAGELEIMGGEPVVWVDQIAEPATGELTITGNAPIIAGNEIVDPTPGALEVEGQTPGLFLGISVTPPTGELILEPGAPEVIIYTESSTISSQMAILAAGEMVPDVHASQQAVLVAGYEIPPVAVSQQVVLVMADAHPCVSRLCQVWLLQRRDGVVLAFTSHDEPVKFMGHTFTPCASLNPSAVEAASDMAAVGNMELTGIIDAEGISEFDLYAGKFDDCRVDVWEIPWAGAFPHPIRLASGTTGSVSHGRDGFRGEVLGPGAKMQQQSVTQVVTAACRFTFGDSRCAKDLGPLTETGAVSAVAASAPFRTFRADAIIGSGPEGYFGRGVVTWTSGANTGVRSEVKEYDPVTGTVVLWNLLPSPASPGDAFTISPGCTLAKDGDMGCVYWGNLINFGGFPDVPGDDATAETPIAKI